MSGESAESEEQGAADWLAWVVLAAVVAIGLASILSTHYLPTHDGPQHIYTVHAAQNLGDAEAGFDRYLEVGHPITAHGFAAVFAPFDSWLPWLDAYRIALAIMLLVWISGSVALARSLNPRRIWLGIALAGFGFQWSLYMGLFSFYIATAFGLWVLAFAIARKEFYARDHLIAGGLLFVQALLHIFPALLTAGVLGLLALARTGGGQRLREAALSLISMTPTLIIAAVLLIDSAEQAQYHDRGSDLFDYEWPGLWIIGKCFAGGPAWRAWTLTFFACISPIAAAGLVRNRLDASGRVLLWIGALLLLAAIGLPLHLPGWDFFSLRFLPLAMSLLVVAFPLEALSRFAQRTIAAGVTLLALASSLWAFDYNRDLDARSATALSGLSAPVTRDGPRLAIVMDPYLGRPLDDRQALMPFVVPLLNLGQLYAAEQGGLAADTFAVSPTTHQVLIRKDAEPFPAYPDRTYAIDLARAAQSERPQLRRKIASYAASFGSAFEDVIFFGTPDDAQVLVERGYEVDYRNEGFMLAHFRGCSLSLEVTDSQSGTNARPNAASNTQIEMGWFPLLEASQRFRLSDSAPAIFKLRGAPCGPVWLRVTSAAANENPSEALTRTCRGADAEGRLILADPRTTPVVHCDLENS